MWSREGTEIAFNSNARNGKDMDIYTCDGRNPESVRKLAEVNGHWYPLDWSPDGSRILAMEYISILDSRLHLIDAATGEIERITPKEKIASYRRAVFGADRETIYATTDREGEYVELYEVDLKSGEWKPITRDISWNIRDIAISSDSGVLAFTANEEGYNRFYAYETATQKVRRIEGIPSGLILGLHFARKANKVVFTLETPTKSEDAYSYDLDENRLVRWTDSEMAGLNPAELVEPELIRFKSFDGIEIPAFYFRPEGEGPFPVVVKIHGGPESQARPGFYPYFQYLVKEKGIAVLMPNVRGSDGYGKTYLAMDNGFKREDSVRDIGALLDWVETRPELDSSRVGVYGGSYGGYMVLASLMHFPDRIVAGADYVGISSFISFLENTEEYRRDLRRAEYGDERDPEMRKFFEKISPLYNTDKIKSALFVAHGANDPRVPASETEQIVEAVRSQGQKVWYMLAKNEGHGFVRKNNRDSFYLLLLMFFEHHLTK